MVRTNQAAESVSPVVLPTIWQLLRHELLYVLYGLMEVALIAPLILAFSPWMLFWSPSILTLLLLLLMLIPFNLSRLAGLLEIPVHRQQIILALALIVMLLVTWRTLLYETNSWADLTWLGELWGHLNQRDNPLWSRDLAIFVMVVLMWWRGISMVGRRIDIGDVGFRLRVGVLLLLLFVAGLAGSLLSWPVTPFVLLFFFTSLMAIVLTRIEQLERTRSGHSFPLGLRWLITVTFAAGVVVFLTGLSASFISGESITRTIGWLSPLWTALYFLASTVFITTSVLFSPFIIALGWLLNLLIGIIEPTLQLGLENFQITVQSQMVATEAEEITEAANQGFQLPRQLLPLLIMLFFILLVTLALGRIFRSTRFTTSSQSEPLHPLSGLGEFEKPSIRRRLLDRLGLIRRLRAAASIRHIYREMCHRAAELGYARTQSETPYEYLTTLDQLWPENADDVRRITEAFVILRYGEVPETREELDRIRVAWKKISVAPTSVDPANKSKPA